MRSILIVLFLAAPAVSQEFFAVGEALYWGASSSEFQNRYNPELDVEHDWRPGFRAGLGLQNAWGWKASWNYTWYATDDTRVWEPASADARFTSYGDLDHQLHDFEIGRELWLHSCLKVEPFAGFRWGQIDYSLQDTGGRNGMLALHSSTDSYGARVGGKAQCYLPAGFSLLGEGAFSGLFSTTQNTGATGSGNWDVTDNHENHSVDALAGVAWQCGLMEVAGGYEWHWWANSIQRRSAMSQADYQDLLLEGAFLRVTGRY